MTNLSEHQFNEIMTIVKSNLSKHREFLINTYGYSSMIEHKIKELEDNIALNLQQLIDLNE